MQPGRKGTFRRGNGEHVATNPEQEDMRIGADLNGHVGGTRTRFEREHRVNCWGDINAEGEEILQFAQVYDWE